MRRKAYNALRRPEAGLVAALVLAAGSAAAVLDAGEPYRGADIFGVGFAMAAAAVLWWRKSAPVAVLAATAVVVVANAAAGYAATVVHWFPWIALFTCFSLRGRRARVVAVVLTVGAVAGYAAFDRGPVGTLELFGIAMCALIASAAGDAAYSRRIATAAEQARLRAEEREVLARELHDSLGHAVNVMVLQAGVGRRVFADNPAFALEALGHVESVGREALGELDRLVRVVRDERAAPDLGLLADRVRAAGREMRLEAEDVDLGPGAAQALHRIVQEAVTNALRHSTGGRIDVGLARVGDKVVLDVVNESDRPTVVPGRGLANMRERARSAGGELDAGPFEGGFRVRATLPAGGRA
ncbi:sensor histidine kinase [Yinghuangia soli]|uniref:histidine kinase n=1 Tax=Yinghuangia soli TaxID=2908204 RepID=A0AA41PWI7_9ACTN|nr:histidine kinase [Yinghuangia soli]MCF2527028.1 histidine kinase [Yinghuangia soli]